MKTAIVIGHDSKSPGAYSKYLGSSEYIYNSEVAANLSGVADIYKRPNIRGYNSQMDALAQLLRPCKYDLIIELHFNSFNKKAKGTETVTYEGNSTTLEYGRIFNELISSKYHNENRGEKTVSRSTDRGFGFLSKMNADAIILEPFFGDNGESLNFKDVQQYACVIKDWLLKIK
jgi:N-acetylmuramoyl-L-alanine amidase